MKNIIEKIREGRTQPTHVDKHIAMITGQPFFPSPIHYRNEETDDRYYHIAGSIGWPSKKPGFGLILAVEKTDSKRPPFRVLEEHEDQDIERLMRWCLQIRQKYGFKRAGLMEFWYGDCQRFNTIVSNFNEKQNRAEKYGLFITPPYDFELSNSFEIYLNQIRTCLSTDQSGTKRLYLGEAKGLVNHIKNLPPDILTKGKIQDYPAIAALGFVIHTLTVSKPWEQTVGYDELGLTTFEQYAVKDQQDAFRYLQQGDGFMPDAEIETEDYGMISTVED